MKLLPKICLVSLIVYSLLAVHLHAGQRAIRVTAKTPDGTQVPLYRGSYALVVGNENYTGGWDPLPGATRDVKDVAEALERNGFQVTFRTDLTRNAFTREMEGFCYRYGRDEDNRILFYFAGHGHTQEMATGEDLGYLVMVDAPVPEKDPVGFGLSSVDMQSIITRAKMIKARHVLFMFDSCFSGSLLNLRERVVPQTISESMRLPVRQFITAGRANEPVPDHSIFKQAFLDLLEGRDREPIPDGYITGEELGLYLKNKVPEYNPTQHPQYGKINDIRLDKGDFVFVIKEASLTPGPPEPTGITDYDEVIQEREADRKRWSQWQANMEKDFAKAERYDRSGALTSREKAEAWASFLSSYSADNPSTSRDDDMKRLAEKRRARWISRKTTISAQTPPYSLPSPSPAHADRDGRYIASANGIVIDTSTSLEWVAGPDRDMTWDEARSWIESLTTDGGGWRMPSIAELKGLYRENAGHRNMTPLLKTTGWSVWSGEAKDLASRWAFLFHFGSAICYGRSYAYEGRAFAVRSQGRG
jgi:hypothetical protein